jgi:hypothetical protein
MLNRARPGLQTLVAFGGVAALEILFFVLRRLGNLKLYVIGTIAVCFAAGIIYLLALFFFEHTGESRAALWLILAGAVLFRVTLLPLTPTLSDDLYRYRWDGRIQQVGWNPYAVKPDDPRLASFRTPDDPPLPGHDIPSIYPPLAELTFRAAARFLPVPVAFKLPFFAADLLTMFLLAVWLRSTGGRNFQLAIYAWNPLVVVEFAGSGHSDALALAALVAAFVIIRSHPRVSTLLLAAAALFKSFPLLLFPAWLRRAGWPRSLRSWGDAIASAAFAAVCFWPYRSALRQIPANMAYFESRWRDNNSSLYALLTMFSGSPDLAAGLGVGVAAGIAVWAAARRMEPLRAAYLILGAVLMLTPNAYSWYFTWMVPLLCFFPNPAWLLLTILQFLSYHVLIEYGILGIWHWQPRMVFLTYAPFYALLLWQRFRTRSKISAT